MRVKDVDARPLQAIFQYDLTPLASISNEEK
jgi:hypothetical protein